jgi:Tfp pilus assembly protein PilN
MRAVNLIPPEERRGERAPLRAGAFSYAIVGVLAAALLGVVMLVMTGNTITEKESELSALEARQAAAEQRVQELAPYGEFASLSDSRELTISTLAKSRFDWDRVLHELALVIPGDVWLSTMTGSVSSAVATGGTDTGATTATDPSIAGPSLQISGCANGQVAVARFVASLRDIDGVTRVGLKQSELGEEDSATSTSATTDSGTGGSGECQTREFIAAFEISVAFDAVPVAATAASVAPTTPATTTTTTDAETADAAAESESTEDSAATQTEEAQDGASAVGVGG